MGSQPIATDAIATETKTAGLAPGADPTADDPTADPTTTKTTITTTTITTSLTGHPLTVPAQRLPVGHHGPAPRHTGQPTCTAAAPGSALPRTETRSWTLRPADHPAAATADPATALLLQAAPTLAVSTSDELILTNRPYHEQLLINNSRLQSIHSKIAHRNTLK